MANTEAYDFICNKIAAMKKDYPSLRNKSEDYVFTALCMRANFYKNPAIDFNEQTISESIVDGQYDGGVDALLIDPNSEEDNLILVQSKFYKDVTFDVVRDAVQKMTLFYKDMERGDYQNVNQVVQTRFLNLQSRIGEESKVVFVFYTSASKNRIRKDRIEKMLKEQFPDSDKFEVALYFVDNLVEEIKELESRRPTVESGDLHIDEANNALYYGDDAVIVNVSAFSIKELYARYNTNLLSRNLRYYIKKRDIDKSINETINDEPEHFWFRNNGLTIVCNEFDVDGKIVHLKDFSIVNGGQTTSLIHKSKGISKERDLYLPCKIIRAIGDSLDERNQFILNIAKATNSQKPIKQIDLKANSPEQVRFSNSMREKGVFYQTKRGEAVPKDFKVDYLNADLAQVGKLCLAGVFQLPASSRNKPSMLYNEKFYEPVFDRSQDKMAAIVKQLLYIDYYFQKVFIKDFDKQNAGKATNPIPFAHNARTVCIAFASLAARIKSGNITDEILKKLFHHFKENNGYDDYVYRDFANLGDNDFLFSKELFNDNDKFDNTLNKLFNVIIRSGFRYYRTWQSGAGPISESNFLKNDINYFAILESDWMDLGSKIDEIME